MGAQVSIETCIEHQLALKRQPVTVMITFSSRSASSSPNNSTHSAELPRTPRSAAPRSRPSTPHALASSAPSAGRSPYAASFFAPLVGSKPRSRQLHKSQMQSPPRACVEHFLRALGRILPSVCCTQSPTPQCPAPANLPGAPGPSHLGTREAMPPKPQTSRLRAALRSSSSAARRPFASPCANSPPGTSGSSLCVAHSATAAAPAREHSRLISPK